VVQSLDKSISILEGFAAGGAAKTTEN
jgi:hypothetical protein